MTESASLGLSEGVIAKMLKKDVPERSYEGHAEYVHRYLIPNIIEVISANNEAILFALKEQGVYDKKY